MIVSSIRQSAFSRLISLCLMVTFVMTMVVTPRAQAGVMGLPQPGTMVNLSSAYVPLMITGLTVHPENPLLMDFIVSTGNSGLNAGQVKKESNRLIKYFLACLTIPENNQWVNLSPYEKDRIISDDLGQTVLGQDMLAQDYILKQLTASLIYPEKNLGKNFWDKVYAKASQQYGTTQIPVNTFNKVWILPDTAKVYEHNHTVFVVKSHLTVMLDEDYLALYKHANGGVAEGNHLGNQIIREIILPAIEKEVNTGKNFAQLRQIYNSMILAFWYKKNLKQALLNQVYTDKSKVNGVNVDDPAIKERIYRQYLQAYKKGAFNYIKEEIDQNNQQVIPRKYFSGGIGTITNETSASRSEAMLALGKQEGDDVNFRETVGLSGSTKGERHQNVAIVQKQLDLYAAQQAIVRLSLFRLLGLHPFSGNQASKAMTAAVVKTGLAAEPGWDDKDARYKITAIQKKYENSPEFREVAGYKRALKARLEGNVRVAPETPSANQAMMTEASRKRVDSIREGVLRYLLSKHIPVEYGVSVQVAPISEGFYTVEVAQANRNIERKLSLDVQELASAELSGFYVHPNPYSKDPYVYRFVLEDKEMTDAARAKLAIGLDTASYFDIIGVDGSIHKVHAQGGRLMDSAGQEHEPQLYDGKIRTPKGYVQPSLVGYEAMAAIPLRSGIGLASNPAMTGDWDESPEPSLGQSIVSKGLLAGAVLSLTGLFVLLMDGKNAVIRSNHQSAVDAGRMQSNEEWSTYGASSGEMLSDIATYTGADLVRLYTVNGIAPQETKVAIGGQSLIIPGRKQMSVGLPYGSKKMTKSQIYQGLFNDPHDKRGIEYSGYFIGQDGHVDYVTGKLTDGVSFSSMTGDSIALTFYTDTKEGQALEGQWDKYLQGKDHAQTTAPGGIDLASQHLKMESSGDKVNITFDPAMIAQFKRGDFSGVRIQILDVVPVNLMPLLGLKEDQVI